MQTEAGTSGRDASPRMLGANDRRTRFGLSLKVVAIAGASTAIVALILALSFGREVEKLLEQELADRGRLAALALANSSATLVFAQDVTGLEALTAATLADVPGAAYVIARDERGRPLAEAVREDLGDARPKAVDLAELDLGIRFLERSVSVGDRQMLHVVSLITFKSKADAQYLDPLGIEAALGAPAAGNAGVKVLGSVEIGFPYADLTEPDRRREPQVARARVRGARGLPALAIFPLARFTTRPLTQLSEAALGIAQGDLRQDVTRSGSDEVADLGRSFGRMVAELQAMLGELKEAAAALAQESDAMLGAATRQAAMAAQQSAAVAEMNASTQEIAQTSSAAIEQADRVIAVTQTAEESSRAGEGIVEEAVGSTTHVEEHVSRDRHPARRALHAGGRDRRHHRQGQGSVAAVERARPERRHPGGALGGERGELLGDRARDARPGGAVERDRGRGAEAARRDRREQRGGRRRDPAGQREGPVHGRAGAAGGGHDRQPRERVPRVRDGGAARLRRARASRRRA